MKTPKFPTRSILVPLLAIAPAIPAAYATTIDWTGATSTAWATGSNWTGGTAPANDLTTDLAQFNQASYAFQPTATNSASISGLIFGNTSTATGDVTLTTGANTSRLNVGSGGIQVNSQSGAVTIGGNSTRGVQLGASQTWTNNSASTLTVHSVSGQTAGGNYGLTINGSGNVTIAGAITNSYSSPSATGSLSLTINTTGGVTTLSATGNAFTGDTTLTSGVLAYNVSAALANSALNTAGTGTITTNQTKLNFGGLKGSRDLSSIVTSGYTGVTLVTLNPLSGTSTYSGIIANGSSGMGVTKSGAGTQVLGGANTYTGKTVISAGTLQVDGTHTGAGAYEVTGATLAGSGIASSSGFTFGLSGNLTPGAAGTGNIGTLTLNGPVIATAATTFSFDIGGAGNTYDIVKLASLNANNIILNLTDNGAYTFVAGDQLHLFENTLGGNTSISGTFASINLPSIAGLTWDTSALYTSGYLTLTSVPEPSTYAVILGVLTSGFVCVSRRRYTRACAHSRVC